MTSLRLAALLPAAILLSACPVETRTCGEVDTIDYTGCDLASVAEVDRSGIWNTHVTAEDGGTTSIEVWRYFDGGVPEIGGQDPHFAEFDGGTFFFGVELGTGEGRVRIVYSGCDAPAPGQLTGSVVRCEGGLQSQRWDFDSRRLGWPSEQEALGLSLLAEAKPQAVSALAADVVVADMGVLGRFAFVALGPGGLRVYDVTDPSLPTPIADLNNSGDEWNSVAYHNGSLYVASAARGLLHYDVTDPSAPRLISAQPADPITIRTVRVDPVRNLLYASAPLPNAEVLIFDIVNPGSMVHISSFRAVGTDLSQGAFPHDAIPFGDRLYVSYWGLGYVVADVSNEFAPIELQTHALPGPPSQTSQVGTFDLGAGPRTIAFHGSEGWGAHLKVLDVTDPLTVTEIGEWRLGPEASIHQLQLVGSTLYVAYHQQGVRVLDVSDPTQPVEVAHYNTWREGDPGRGRFFLDGVTSTFTAGDGLVYATETSRGLMILAED